MYQLQHKMLQPYRKGNKCVLKYYLFRQHRLLCREQKACTETQPNSFLESTFGVLALLLRQWLPLLFVCFSVIYTHRDRFDRHKVLQHCRKQAMVLVSLFRKCRLLFSTWHHRLPLHDACSEMKTQYLPLCAFNLKGNFFWACRACLHRDYWTFQL